MNQKFTRAFPALFLIVFLQSTILLGATMKSFYSGELPVTSTLPVDSPKKKPAPVPVPAPAALVTFPLSLKNKLSLSGYTQARYVYNFLEGVKTNTFDVRRARVDLRGNIGTKWAYRTQIDFAPTVRVLDATVAFTANPYFRVTAGQGKIAFSLENIISSPLMESINRSQVVEALVSRSTDVISGSGGNNNGRDIGVQVSGGIPIPVDSTSKRNIVEYYLGVYNGNGINKADNNVDKDFAGRLLVMPIQGLQIGGSFYKGQGSYGTDVTIEKKNVTVSEAKCTTTTNGYPSKQNISRVQMIQSAKVATMHNWQRLLSQTKCNSWLNTIHMMRILTKMIMYPLSTHWV